VYESDATLVKKARQAIKADKDIPTNVTVSRCGKSAASYLRDAAVTRALRCPARSPK
jgi:hypothetical protein